MLIFKDDDEMTIAECPLCARPMQTIKSKVSERMKMTMRYCMPCRYAFTYDQDGRMIDIYKDVEM